MIVSVCAWCHKPNSWWDRLKLWIFPDGLVSHGICRKCANAMRDRGWR